MSLETAPNVGRPHTKIQNQTSSMNPGSRMPPVERCYLKEGGNISTPSWLKRFLLFYYYYYYYYYYMVQRQCRWHHWGKL